MMARVALLIGVLALLGGCLGGPAIGDVFDRESPRTPIEPEENVTGTFVIDGAEDVTVTLEVADSREERSRGLMFRESLPTNHGMVFVYDEAAPRNFWMKNTPLPLDIIFVAPNGTVLNVGHASPQPNASEDQLERYHSDGDAMYVVELERGFANRTGVGPGTELAFNGSRPTVEPALRRDVR